MDKQISYRVRPVTRYVVTRYDAEYDRATSSGSTGFSTQRGEFDNFETAYAVAYALCKKEHDDSGLPPGDERFQYPEQIIRGPAQARNEALWTGS